MFVIALLMMELGDSFISLLVNYCTGDAGEGLQGSPLEKNSNYN